MSDDSEFGATGPDPQASANPSTGSPGSSRPDPSPADPSPPPSRRSALGRWWEGLGGANQVFLLSAVLTLVGVFVTGGFLLVGNSKSSNGDGSDGTGSDSTQVKTEPGRSGPGSTEPVSSSAASPSPTVLVVPLTKEQVSVMS